jgi:hypothetical protein
VCRCRRRAARWRRQWWKWHDNVIKMDTNNQPLCNKNWPFRNFYFFFFYLFTRYYGTNAKKKFLLLLLTLQCICSHLFSYNELYFILS